MDGVPIITRSLSNTLSGWKLTCVLIVAIAVCSTLAAMAVGGASGANLGIRYTARTSAILFLLAFTASSLYQLWPTSTTKWIRRNRRYLGVAFAGSHLVHAVFIVATIILNRQRFETGVEHTPHAIYLVDFIAYGFIIAMTITSFDRISKRMQYATWHRLHLTGSYVIWFAFFIAYWRRGVTYTEFYGPFLIIVMAALIIRFIAKAKRIGNRRNANQPARSEIPSKSLNAL
jgi:methionine sulfoxide reductase heme-binding subunit